LEKSAIEGGVANCVHHIPNNAPHQEEKAKKRENASKESKAKKILNA